MSKRSEAVAVLLPVGLVIVFAVILALAFEQRGAKSVPRGPQTVTNSVGIELVPIPGGSFIMGSDSVAGQGSEAPSHPVQVAPFYLGKYEVTQAQWQAVMGYNPSSYKHPQRPVDQVTWLEVQSFIERLNRLEGTSLYRLPSEAEWEYAARAGTKGKWSFGDDPTQLSRFAWFGQHGDIGTQLVGGRAPNPWGLYDMYGNVWEWVQDCWHDNYNGAPREATIWSGGDCSLRMLRGGGWNSPAEYTRSAVRGSYSPQMNDPADGFRLARSR
jgi:formylglycine-generating enzyme required for sulfatase activity